jgi:hypothetical protein
MSELEATFARLRELLAPYAAELDARRDDDEQLYLDTRHRMNNGRVLFFGAVQRRKRYVAFHLMPVYTDPELLNDVSDALARRMQGKSCFNFTKVDACLFDELAALTERGYQRYREHGYV